MHLFERMIFSVFLVLLMGCSSGKKSGSCETDRRVNELLSKMNLKKKVGQMSMVDIATLMKRANAGGSFYGPYIEPNVLDRDSVQKYIVDYGISCVFNIGPHAYTIGEWYDYLKELQDYAMQKTRLGIPVLYGADAMHGASLTAGATLFP